MSEMTPNDLWDFVHALRGELDDDERSVLLDCVTQWEADRARIEELETVLAKGQETCRVTDMP